MPLYPLIWFNQVALLDLGLPWAPLAGMKLLFFALAVLVPGPYWINFLLMSGVALESFALWGTVSHFPNHTFLIFPPEPLHTLIYGVISFVLLAVIQETRRGKDQGPIIEAGTCREPGKSR